MTSIGVEGYESPGSTSSGLLQQVRDQDQMAWQRMLRLYGRLVLHWCSQSGLQRADRSDVFQEVFRAVSQHIATFRNDRPGDTFRGWLRTVTRSKILDHYRRLGREPAGTGGSDMHGRLMEAPDDWRDQEPGSHSGFEQSVMINEALNIARSYFEAHTWQAFWRTVADGVPTAVVADELQMTPAAVRKAKSRVLRRLREVAGGVLEDLPDEA